MPVPTPDSYSAASGVTIYAGRNAPSITGSVGIAVSAMTANTMTDFLGTNINNLYAGGPDGGTNSVFESAGNYLIQPWAGKGWYDQTRGVLGMIGTAQGFSGETPPGAHTKGVYFDLPTNTFTGVWNPCSGGGGGHMYDNNCGITMGGKFIRKGYNDPMVYQGDVVTKVISLLYTSACTDQVTAIEFFPTMGTQGSIILLGETGKLFVYDKATGIETLFGTYAGISSYGVCIYVPGSNCIVFGCGSTGTKLYKLITAGTVTEIVQTLPTSLAVAADSAQGPAVAHPGGDGSVLVFSATTNALYKFTVATGAWVKLQDFTGVFSGQMAACCAVSLHSVGAVALFRAGGRSGGTPNITQCKFYLYKS